MFFFFVWGSYPRKKVFYKTNIPCPLCGGDTLEYVKAGRLAHFCYIPLFPYGKTYYAGCKCCGRGRIMGATQFNAEVDAIKNSNPADPNAIPNIVFGYTPVGNAPYINQTAPQNGAVTYSPPVQRPISAGDAFANPAARAQMLENWKKNQQENNETPESSV